MLWMKNWFETRLRLLLAFTVLAFLLVVAYQQFRFAQRAPTPLPAETRLQGLLFMIGVYFIMEAIIFAAAGIKTQAPFRRVKGTHSSTHFTLSLPVSRLRLLAMRMTTGLLALLAIVIAGLVGLAILLPIAFPELRFPVSDFIRYGLAVFACLLGFFSISTLLSAFLDDIWQAWGSMLLSALLAALASFTLPDQLNPYRVLAGTSPLLTHTTPWGAMAISIVVAAVLITITAKVVQSRDF